MTTSVDSPTVQQLADRVADLLRTYRGADVFAPDALFDINVPIWRFQVRGAERFLAWLQGYAPHGYSITVTRVIETTSGFVMEIEGEYEHHGIPLFFRNLYVAELANNQITELSFWCTGDWDPETRARHEVEAPMLRR
jgi:hypothetical protein